MLPNDFKKSAPRTMLLEANAVLAAHEGDLVAVRACRAAESMTRDPEVGSRGQRAIEEASGVARTHLLGSKYTKAGKTYVINPVLPEQGEVDPYGLIKCVERGDVDYAQDVFEVGQYVVADRAGICATKPSSLSNPLSLSSSTTTTSEKTKINPTRAHGGADSRPIEDLLAEGRRRLLDPKVIAALDPKFDHWGPWSSQYPDRMGDHGWALAVRLGLQDCELPVTEVYRLLGLKKDAGKAFVDKLAKSRIATVEKRGRSKVVCFSWSLFMVESDDEYFTRVERATKKSEKAHHKRVRKTPAEKLAWATIWGHRSDEAIEAMSDIEREWLMKARTDKRVEAELVQAYERGLENTKRMLQAYIARKARKAIQKPVEPLTPVSLTQEVDADLQARIDALVADIYAPV